jgi:hypothetical protein
MKSGLLDIEHHLVDLDRVSEVVDEEDEHDHAHEEQQERAADRQPWIVRRALAARDPDGVQPCRAVGEGGDEAAQGQLVDQVAQEVAQQARAELSRGQLECHDG